MTGRRPEGFPSAREQARADRRAQFERGSRLGQLETFPGTGPGNTATPSSPGGQVNPGSRVPPVNVTRQPPYGETITVTRGSQVFDGGGTDVEWTDLLPGLTAAGNSDLQLPTTVWSAPRRAYYRLDLEVEWLSWLKGGTVRVFIDGQQVWVRRSPFGPGFRRTLSLGVLDVGQQVTVRVSPVGFQVAEGEGFDGVPDGQVGEVVGTFELVELPVDVRSDPPPAVPTVTGVASRESSNTVLTAGLNIQAGQRLFLIASRSTANTPSVDNYPVISTPSGWTLLTSHQYFNAAGGINWPVVYVFTKVAEVADETVESYGVSASPSGIKANQTLIVMDSAPAVVGSDADGSPSYEGSGYEPDLSFTAGEVTVIFGYSNRTVEADSVAPPVLDDPDGATLLFDTNPSSNASTRVRVWVAGPASSARISTAETAGHSLRGAAVSM